MFYYLYEICNKINGKIYIGVHKTKDMNDGYMGSGKVIKRAIKNHGIENFEKIILETFYNSDSMYAREKEIVTDEFLMREDVYNLRRGGAGGFDYINNLGIPKMLGKKHSEETKAKQGHEWTETEREALAQRMIGNTYGSALRVKGNLHPAAKPKSTEHKEKLREKNLGVKHKRIICPHCGKECGERAIKQWHKNCGIGTLAVS